MVGPDNNIYLTIGEIDAAIKLKLKMSRMALCPMAQVAYLDLHQMASRSMVAYLGTPIHWISIMPTV